MTDTVEQLIAAGNRAATCDVSTLDSDQLGQLLDAICSVDHAMTNLKVRAGQRANLLAASGRGPDASDLFSTRGESSHRTARRDADRAATITDNPDLDRPFDEGKIGGEHLDAIARARRTVAPENRDLFDRSVGDLTSKASIPNPDTFNQQVRRVAQRIENDHGLSTALRQRDASEVRTWTDRNGMGHLKATLDPERFSSVIDAIDKHSASLASAATRSGEPVTKGPALDATALVELVQAGTGTLGRTDMLVIVDAETIVTGPHPESIRETRNGHPLAHETVKRLSCDALVRRVILDPAGVAIDVGRTYRTATDGQWAALNSMYRTCAWAGCDRPISRCQAHHIVEWTHGGKTDLDNLVPLCSTHHHRVHEGQWTIKLLPDRTLRIHQPDGVHWANVSPDRIEGNSSVTDERERRLTHN